MDAHIFQVTCTAANIVGKSYFTRLFPSKNPYIYSHVWTYVEMKTNDFKEVKRKLKGKNGTKSQT